MVGLTKAKPFQKQKRRGKNKRSIKTRSLQINAKLLMWTIWIVIFFVVFIYGTSLVLKRTILAPKYIINEVRYAEESVAEYDEPYLYKEISKHIK